MKISIAKDSVQKLFDLSIKEKRNIGELSIELFEKYINDRIGFLENPNTDKQKKPYTIKERVDAPIANLTIDLFASNIIKTLNVKITPDELKENREKLREFLGDIVDYIVHIDSFSTHHIVKAINDCGKNLDMATHSAFSDIIHEKKMFDSLGIPYYKEISVFAYPGPSEKMKSV